MDENPDMTVGYILTGSHQLQLREAITQSLAGRTALLELFPFALGELSEEYTLKDRETMIFNGFMPRLHDKNIRPKRLYRDYFQTYVERDVRKLMAIATHLSISSVTVKSLLRNIFRKLQVSKRQDAGAEATRAGLLPDK